MKIFKNKKVLITVVIAIVILGGVALAATLQSATNNNIGTSKLSGQLVVQTDETQSLYPGVWNNYTVSAQNTGNIPMVARAKIDATWFDGETQVPINSGDVEIEYATGDWQYGNDGYYYYTKEIDPQDLTSTLCTAFRLSPNLTNIVAGRRVELVVTLECLQYASDAIETVWGHNYADFGMNEPAQQTYDAAEVTYVSGESNFTVSYNFFTAFAGMVPGETRTQDMVISNTSGQNAEILLKATLKDPNDQTASQLMRDNSVISIYDEKGNLLFNGSVLGGVNSLSTWFSLGDFSKNEQKTYKVVMEISSSAGNEYQDITNRVTWDFSANTIIASPTPQPALDKTDHFAYMQGYPDGSFKPSGNMTRAEVTVMFARLMANKMNINETYINSFNDVSADSWYYNEIGYMQKYGIIQGDDYGNFRPDSPITRAEFAAIVSRFDKLVTTQDFQFTDVPADYWAHDYILSAAAKGWVEGYPGGYFNPDGFITRAEVVTVANRMLERVCDENFVNANYSEIIKFNDVSQDYWAYWDIIEATNSHDYNKNSGSEIWTKLQ